MTIRVVVPPEYEKEKLTENDKKHFAGFAPCGHTFAQAAWLGCTDTECRKPDADLVRRYEMWVKAGKPERPW